MPNFISASDILFLISYSFEGKCIHFEAKWYIMAWQTFTLSFDLVQWWIPNVLTAIQVEPEFLKKYEQKIFISVLRDQWFMDLLFVYYILLIFIYCWCFCSFKTPIAPLYKNNMLIYNHVHNILGLFDDWADFRVTKSETKHDY